MGTVSHAYYDETEVAFHDTIVQNGAAHFTGIVTVRIWKITTLDKTQKIYSYKVDSYIYQVAIAILLNHLSKLIYKCSS